jgi:hypothetical protein
VLRVPPLRWVYGDDLGNIRRLVDLNLATLKNAGQDDIQFDLATGNYTDANGDPVGRDGIGARVAAGAGRGAIAGSKTLARGAVLRALVREEGAALEGPDGRRDGLLARLAGIADDPSTAGLFYSRAGSPANGNASPVADPPRLRLVRAAVDEITAGWAEAPKIEVLASMHDAPAEVRAANSRQLRRGAQGEAAAFYFDGRVYLVASQMQSRRDVAEAVAPDCRQTVVGIRPGEKIHEEMITASDSPNTVDLGDYYAILPTGADYTLDDYCARQGAHRVPPGFSYDSGSNNQFLSVPQLRALIDTQVSGAVSH